MSALRSIYPDYGVSPKRQWQKYLRPVTVPPPVGRYFEKLLSSEPSDKIDNKPSGFDPNATPSPINSKYTAIEIGATVPELKNNKVSDGFGLTSEVVKNSDPSINIWMKKLFITFWHSEMIPYDWKTALLLPV